MNDEEQDKPIKPGTAQPNGQTSKGNLDEPAHMGNLDNGLKEDDEEEGTEEA